jgi:hypothetical protein
MAKRLKHLKIKEVSIVDRGAGEGVRVVMMKRRPRYEFNDAYSLVPIVDPVERAKREIADNLAVAKSLSASLGDIEMHTEVSEVAKAAQAIVKRFDDRVAEIAKRHSISHNAALLKISSSPEDAALWRDYRQAQQLIAPPTPTPEPAPVVVSDAYSKMMAKAERRAEKNGTSVATEFSKIYQARPDLAQQDKQHFFDKAAGGVDANESLIIAIMAALGCDRARAAGLALEMRSKNPAESLLHVTTRDAA